MEKNEKTTLNSRVTSLIVKIRIPIIVLLVLLILGAIGTSIILSISNNNIVTGLTNLDTIEFKYESLDRASDSYEDNQQDLASQAVELANSSNGIVKIRSLLFSADINFDLENWTEARDQYLEAYEENTNLYTAPLALYNAAISSEELQEFDVAVEYLTMISNYEDFSLRARTLFNLGRIEDTRGNYQEAAESYQKLNDDFPSTSWANLAKSRLITLNAEGLVD